MVAIILGNVFGGEEPEMAKFQLQTLVVLQIVEFRGLGSRFVG